MKKLLFVFVFFICFDSYCSEVSGNIFLDNNSNFENIKITFSPVSPSAVFAETYSNLNGYFKTSVTNGIYNVIYSKVGYQNYQVDNVFVTSDLILGNYTLSSNALIDISGDVEGNWTKNNTYKIVGNTTVNYNKILNIEEGTEIKFDGKYSLIVNGKLVVNGNTNNYVKFSSSKVPPTRDDWNQIIINGEAIMNYSIVEYGKENSDWNGMIRVLGKASISNSIIRETNGTAISISNSSSNALINNEIYNSDWAIIVDGEGVTNVSRNRIDNTRLGGVLVRSDALNTELTNNTLGNCGQMCISLFGTNTLVEKNIVFNSNYGISVSRNNPKIFNNTIIFNNYGIFLETYETTNIAPVVNSNIIAYNNMFAVYSGGKPKPSQVVYNLFYGNNSNGNNNLPIGTGSVITKNSNGTPSDTYFNLFLDPQFVSTSSKNSAFCELLSSSVAINAGDPARKDLDNSIIDIGAKNYDQTLSIDHGYFLNKSNLLVYPNVFTNFLNFESKIGIKEISLFNANGTKVHSTNFQDAISKHTENLSSNLPGGLYLYFVKDDNDKIYTGKILKNN
jgi:parallel beta-helix repeat protein